MLFALAGCKHPYEWTPETLRIRARLDAEHAQQIVAGSLRPNADGKGGAQTAYADNGLFVDVPYEAQVRDNRIEYMASGPYAKEDDDIGPECRRASGELVPATGRDVVPTVCRYAIQLDHLDSVIIIPCSDPLETSRELPGYLVRMNQTLLTHFVVSVPAAGLEPLVAALSFYSPKAGFSVGSNC
jgi:hypothetical protein